MRTRLVFPILTAALFVTACRKSPPKEVSLGAAFHTIPLPPDAQALVREGGTDAMQLVLVTPMNPDAVLNYYRKTLSADPFHLVNEQTTGKTTALYAEQDRGPSIWVTISPNGSEGSQVILAGAKDANSRDSGAANSPPVRKP